MKKNGFTLIELLIVVAIIGVLAAIAVPNFLNAQIRAGVARVKADHKAISSALQMYFMDHNTYPPDLVGPDQEDRSYRYLTTPVAFLTSTEVCRDYFTSKAGRSDEAGFVRNFYDYGHVPYIREAGVGFVVVSFAPDRRLNMPWDATAMKILKDHDAPKSYFLYASSNGLISSGDIITTALGIHND